MTTRTAIAANFDLWREYIDTQGVMSREEFDAMSHLERLELIAETFGPEPERALTVDQMLDSTAIGNGLHQWHADAAVTTWTTEQLRPALEEAYDPDMPNWPALVELPDA